MVTPTPRATQAINLDPYPRASPALSPKTTFPILNSTGIRQQFVKCRIARTHAQHFTAQAAVFVGGHGGNPLFVKKSPILCGFLPLTAGGLSAVYKPFG